nr:uncharacterized protein LOC123746012 [Procambarus clarkii]
MVREVPTAGASKLTGSLGRGFQLVTIKGQGRLHKKRGIQLMWTTSEAGGPGGGHRGTPAVLKLSHWRDRATTADNREGDEDGLWVLKNVHNGIVARHCLASRKDIKGWSRR